MSNMKMVKYDDGRFEPIPAPGGGFNWRSSTTLLRHGREIARAEGWSVTWATDYQNPKLGEEFAKLIDVAKPGDVVVYVTVHLGNQGWTSSTQGVVVDPEAARVRYGRPLERDPLLDKAFYRPYAANRRRWTKAANLAALKIRAKDPERVWKMRHGICV